MSVSTLRNNYILVGAIIIYLLVTIVPIIDLLSNWYVTMIPVAVMLFFLFLDRNSFRTTILFLTLGLLTVLLDYYFISPRNNFGPYVLRHVITWIPCLIAILCVNSISLRTQQFILQIALLLMAVTSFTTIMGLAVFPHAARALAGTADQALRNEYALLNIGGFDFIYALAISIPIVMWLIDYTKGWVKGLNIIILILFLYCIYMSAYTTALIMSIIILMLVLINKHPQYKSIAIFTSVVLVFWGGTGILSSAVMWFSSFVEDEYVVDRLHQVALLLQGQTVEQIDTKTTNDRLMLMQQAWNGFLASPLYGNNIDGYQKSLMSGHSYVLDILSASGLIGLAVYFTLYRKIFKTIVAPRFTSLIFHARIVWLAFIILIIMNPAFFPIIYLALFSFTFIVNNLNKYETSHDEQQHK